MALAAISSVDALQTLGALQALGLTLPSPTYLVGALGFGIVGWLAWRRGCKNSNWRTAGLGVALMLYPYVIAGTAMLFGVGAALCAALYFTAGTDAA